MIGRYGPVIKYEKAGQTKFIPVKEDIDFEKLKRGEYTLDEIKKEKNYGGKVLGSVSKKLDFLVVGESKPTKKKIDLAKKLNVQILSENEWNKILNRWTSFIKF